MRVYPVRIHANSTSVHSDLIYVFRPLLFAIWGSRRAAIYLYLEFRTLKSELTTNLISYSTVLFDVVLLQLLLRGTTLCAAGVDLMRSKRNTTNNSKHKELKINVIHLVLPLAPHTCKIKNCFAKSPPPLPSVQIYIHM